MKLEWIHEGQPAHWDAQKQRIVGGAAEGVFDARFSGLGDGTVIPGEWWRIENDGRVVGYGWLDIVWGDAEIQLATERETRGSGVGSFILENLEREAVCRGLRRLYNVVRPTHPDREEITGWLTHRGFEPSEDGSLFRHVAPVRSI